MTGSADLRARVGFCRQAARRVLKEHGVRAPGTPVEEIVREAGFRVLERDWPPRTSGILLRSQSIIGVNGNHPPVRRRFSLAHEFGHYVLNHHLWFESNREVTIDNPPPDGCEGEDKIPEREANIFAGELLVPLSILKAQARAGRSPQQLALAFRVSEETLFIALKEHRLLNRL
jgi:Zn-dependent peptidase ImmA (M78 family)